MLGEGLKQLPAGQLDAFDQRRGALARRVVRRAQRPVEIVADLDDVAGQAGPAIGLGILAVALGALADVLGFGERAHQLVAQRVALGDDGVELGADRIGRLGRRFGVAGRVGGRRGALGFGRFGGLVFGLFVFGHSQPFAPRCRSATIRPMTRAV